MSMDDSNDSLNVSLCSRPSSRRQLFLEESPVKPGVDGKNIKSFEEFLDVSLQNLSGNLDQSAQDVRPEVTIPKRPFLKKGAGLVRFKPPATQRQRFCELQPIVPRRTANSQQIELLPKTCSRITSSVAAAHPVAVSRRNNLPQKCNNKNMFVQNNTERQKEVSSSLENLERLLTSVRGRKQQVLQQLEKTSDNDSSEWESEEGECEEELELQDLLAKRKLVRNPTFTKKKVRWKNNKAGIRSALPNIAQGDEDQTLSKATTGPYSLHLATCIGRLEEKLDQLRNRCSSQGDIISNSEGKDKSKVDDNTEHESKTRELKKDIADLNARIQTLTEGLQTLQLLTVKASNESSKSDPKKKTRVTIHKNSEVGRHEMVISKNLSNNLLSKESHVQYENGCRVQVLPDKTVVHVFPNGTKQSTFVDGSKLIEFANGQTERTLTNGVKYISYPNSTHRTIHPDGSEEITTGDGTLLTIRPDGTEIVVLGNGDREIRSKEYNRREYRNGIIKTVYADGTQETRYPNGRLRIKDRMNNVVVDSMVRTLHQI